MEATMHSLMLVTIAMPTDATSDEVRDKVYDILIDDNSFCGKAGRFGGPLCDWFVIGGRWSGLLAKTIIGRAYSDAVVAKIPEFGRELLPQQLIDSHAEELDALWLQHGGKGPSPYTRSGLEHYGFPDDAMVITQALYDSLLSKYVGDVCATEEFIDLDDESVKPDFVGRKWLVVVDYHQ
jgi:hypothetical protein